MAFSVSPSVIVREVDASAAVPAIATPPAAIASAGLPPTLLPKPSAVRPAYVAGRDAMRIPRVSAFLGRSTTFLFCGLSGFHARSGQPIVV